VLFNSYIFIFTFLPFTFFIYFYLNRKGLVEVGKGFLVFSSLFFYSWWNISYLPLIFTSILVNYVLGSTLSKHDKRLRFSRKFILIFGIVLNILLLGYFKYSDFFIQNYNILFSSNINLLNLALPLAISFFTFQQISYLVDSYRQETKEYDFLNYALFVTFFPQLIAGPIVHHKEMMPQFAQKKNKILNYKNIASGLFIFSIGLFKKVVVADTFAVWATQGFDVASSLNLFEAWATSLSYTMQLYFDFSGYTDMAIGAALLFNIRLPINFNSPYKSYNIQEFWRRWHITLSRFLKDYIYIPLGGNRFGSFRTYLNLIVTFLIGGIWHGAGWTFIFWGMLHGLAIVVHRLWSKFDIRLWNWVAWLVTFNFINITWVFFRAKDLDTALKILSSMFSLDNIVLPNQLSIKLDFLKDYSIKFGDFLQNITANGQEGKMMILSLIVMMFIILVNKNSNQMLKNFNPSAKFSMVMCVLFFIISILKFNEYSEFLYFRF